MYTNEYSDVGEGEDNLNRDKTEISSTEGAEGNADTLQIDEESMVNELIEAYEEEIQAILEEIAALNHRHADLVEQRQKLISRQ